MNRNSKIPFHNELPWHVPSLDGQTKKWLKIRWNKLCTSSKKGHVKYIFLLGVTAKSNQDQKSDDEAEFVQNLHSLQIKDKNVENQVKLNYYS